MATLEEIRAKDGNLSIPLYVASRPTPTVQETGAPYGGDALENALRAWGESSTAVRKSLAVLLEKAEEQH